MSLDDVLQALLEQKQNACEHLVSEHTEIVRGTIHCGGCGKEWTKYSLI